MTFSPTCLGQLTAWEEFFFLIFCASVSAEKKKKHLFFVLVLGYVFGVCFLCVCFGCF